MVPENEHRDGGLKSSSYNILSQICSWIYFFEIFLMTERFSPTTTTLRFEWRPKAVYDELEVELDI